MIRKAFDSLEEILGSILLLAVCVVAVIRVASRYAHLLGENAVSRFVGGAGSWSVELCTYLFIWMVFVGASLALKKHEHFAVEVFVDRLPARATVWAERLSHLFVILFAAILIWFGGAQVAAAWDTVTPALEIPRSVPYAAVPFGGALMLVRATQALFGPSRAAREAEGGGR